MWRYVWQTNNFLQLQILLTLLLFIFSGSKYTRRFRAPSLLEPESAFMIPTRDDSFQRYAICRGYANGSILVGYAHPSLNTCWLPNPEGRQYNQKEEVSKGYEVLENISSAVWLPPSQTMIGNGSILAGGRFKSGETIFVGLCRNLVIDGYQSDSELVPYLPVEWKWLLFHIREEFIRA